MLKIYSDLFFTVNKLYVVDSLVKVMILTTASSSKDVESVKEFLFVFEMFQIRWDCIKI